jgi:hypothetical protein
LLRSLYVYREMYKPSFALPSVFIYIVIIGIGMFDHYLLTLQQGQFLLVLLLSLLHMQNSVINK